jgi:polyisoprenoid-binding protein YceI
MSTASPTETSAPAGVWVLDPGHATLGFVGRHMMFTKVRGRFTDFDAKIEVPADGDLTKVVATATIQAASITSGSDDRDGHLKSPDFLDVEKYPTITFRSTKVEALGGPNYRVTGDLTIKDVTKPVTLDVEFGGIGTSPWGAPVAGVEARTEVDRREWGLEWNMPLDKGGVLVSEKIKLELDFEANLQQ